MLIFFLLCVSSLYTMKRSYNCIDNKLLSQLDYELFEADSKLFEVKNLFLQRELAQEIFAKASGIDDFRCEQNLLWTDAQKKYMKLAVKYGANPNPIVEHESGQNDLGDNLFTETLLNMFILAANHSRYRDTVLIEKIKFLFQLGVDFVSNGTRNYPPLFYALNQNVMKVLLDHGVSINQCDQYGNNIAIIYAKNYPNRESFFLKVIAQFFKLGCDISLPNKKNRNILHIILKYWSQDIRFELIKILIEQYHIPVIVDLEDNNLFHVMAKAPYFLDYNYQKFIDSEESNNDVRNYFINIWNIITYLNQFVDIQGKDNEGRTPFDFVRSYYGQNNKEHVLEYALSHSEELAHDTIKKKFGSIYSVYRYLRLREIGIEKKSTYNNYFKY